MTCVAGVNMLIFLLFQFLAGHTGRVVYPHNNRGNNCPSHSVSESFVAYSLYANTACLIAIALAVSSHFTTKPHSVACIMLHKLSSCGFLHSRPPVVNETTLRIVCVLAMHALSAYHQVARGGTMERRWLFSSCIWHCY